MSTPRIVLSTRTSLTLPLHVWRDVCLHVRADGIDLDVAGSIRRRLLLREISQTSPPASGISYVWIGEKLDDAIRGLILSGAAAVMPSKCATKGRASRSVDQKALATMRQELSGSTRLVVALKPINHDGSRIHLDRISALRHIAEEWDFELGFDLTGDVDPSWEAEAAVLRMGERLGYVRFSPPSFDKIVVRREADHLREVTVARVLGAIADFGLSPALSIKLRVPFWDWSNPAAIAEQLMMARQATIARFQSKPGAIPSPPKRVR